MLSAYNNSLRRLLGLPNHNSANCMFVDLNIPSFRKLLRKYVYNFRNRLETSDNVIIRGIYLSRFPLQSGICDWWLDILSPWLEHRSVYYCILSIFLILIYLIFVYFVFFYRDAASKINI